MPTFNILLAEDVTHYGSVEVEAATWQDAVRTLDEASWDVCTDADDPGERRVVHVEVGDESDIVAEDLAYRCELVSHWSVIRRLTQIIGDPHRVPCVLTQKLLSDLIDELRANIQDPVFKDGEADQ